MLSTYNSTIHTFSVHRGGICAWWENTGQNQDWNTVWKTSNPLALCPVSGLWFRGLRWLRPSSSAAATYISLFSWSHSLHAAPLADICPFWYLQHLGCLYRNSGFPSTASHNGSSGPSCSFSSPAPHHCLSRLLKPQRKNSWPFTLVSFVPPKLYHMDSSAKSGCQFEMHPGANNLAV